jgi:hypothetical protein|tara:strand:- start:1034 stop:1738 length:705 start_codon:yes stop_codon:yes gene_type:complete
MATSGTYTFNLDSGEIIQEAYERIGANPESGYDLKTARRSLNILLTKWANQGVHLFTLNFHTSNMTKDQDYISFNSSIHADVLDGSIRNNKDATKPNDIPMERISLDDYMAVPDKWTKGKPVQFSLERNAQFDSSGSATHKMYLWPVPNQTYYQYVGWTIMYAQDVTTNYAQNPEIPKRYLPALISGLAVELAVKQAPDRLAVLKPLYDQDWQLAREEDRERVSFIVQPQVSHI